MKAITLIQPWATLVAIGAKRIETRSWETLYRGPLAIHAGKSSPKWARAFAQQPVCYETVRLARARYPLGYVLATCRLVNCRRTEDVAALNEREKAFGDYSPGRFAWILEDIQPLPEPIPAKGALGLWEWNR